MAPKNSSSKNTSTVNNTVTPLTTASNSGVQHSSTSKQSSKTSESRSSHKSSNPSASAVTSQSSNPSSTAVTSQSSNPSSTAVTSQSSNPSASAVVTSQSTSVSNPTVVNLSSETHNGESRTESRLSELPEDVRSQLRYERTLELFEKQITSLQDGLRNLRNEYKKLWGSYEYDINKVRKSRKRRNGPAEPTGFIKKTVLPDELADLVGVARGSEMATPELTKRFYKVLETRGLFYTQDRRIFRADEEMLRVFQLDNSVNSSTNFKDTDGFNFMTLQKHISNCLKRYAHVQPVQPNVQPAVQAVQANVQVAESKTSKGGRQSKATTTA